MRAQTVAILLAAMIGAGVLEAGPVSAQVPGPRGGEAVAETPIIGVDPASLDFGCVDVGSTQDLSFDLFNDVMDPESILEITAFNIVFPLLDGSVQSDLDGVIYEVIQPNPPFTIAGDGTRVPVVVRFAPPAAGEVAAQLEVVAPDATNSPQVVDLVGVGNEDPVCDAGGPYMGDEGSPVAFDGTGSSDSGMIVSYEWMFGDGATGSGPTPQHTYAASGVFTVTLTVTDDCETTSSCETTATIEGDNQAPICDAGGPYAADVGATINFDGTGSSDPDGMIVSYAWDFGDGATGSGATPDHAYGSSGVFTVTLTVEDDGGATSSCETTADINAPPTCDANGPYTGIVGEVVNFDGTGSSDPDGSIASYAWEFGDGGTGSGSTPAHAYQSAGEFTVTLCVTDDDGSESCCNAMAIIDETPTPVELATFTALQEGEVVVVRWSSRSEVQNLGFDVYRSEVGAVGEPQRLNDRLIESAGATGEYAFTDRAVSAGSTYEYEVESVGTGGERQSFGPRRVTVVHQAPARLALKPNEPNPFNPSTTVRFEQPRTGDVSLAIYDIYGRPVRTLADRVFEPGVHAIEWDGRDGNGRLMPSGVYFLQLRSADATMTRKMVMAR